MFTHQPVMINETIKNLVHDPAGTYLDCTFGLGGHSKKILENLNDDGRLIAIDRDKETVSYSQKIKDKRFHFKNLNFSKIESLDTKLDGILFDLGNSSMQLDDPERGFSFQKDGPLDMRMNKEEEITAEQWINTATEKEISDVLFHLGEERKSRFYARKIVESRKKTKFKSTAQLSLFIEKYKSSQKRHPATNVFRAIRMHINNEIEEMINGFKSAACLLKQNGKLIIISFHSIEDRIAKNFLRSEEAKNLNLKKQGKPIKPTINEIKSNPRSRSAIMRIAIKNV